jgi:hypothetical protein
VARHLIRNEALELRSIETRIVSKALGLKVTERASDWNGAA